MATTKDKSQCRNLCFTWNNYTPASHEDLVKNLPPYTYLIIGEEVGESGTPHLQGYVEFKSPTRFARLKEKFNQIHWEKRKGTSQQASDYCKKDGKFKEYGTATDQGKRTDLESISEEIVNGASLEQIASLYPHYYVRYFRGFQALQSSLSKHREGPPEVHWRWGKAGVGKTRYCVEKHPSHYIKDASQWWDGYCQQEAIIIDDFDGVKYSYRDLLRLLDRYHIQVQVKGTYVKINSPYIYITCEHPPESFWEGNMLDQVKRRLTSITEVVKNPELS